MRRLRFVCTENRHFGNVEEKELAYFRTDTASLMERASLIGDTLGFSPPALAAIVEPERAAAYRRLANGFAGLYCGPGSTVELPHFSGERSVRDPNCSRAREGVPCTPDTGLSRDSAVAFGPSGKGYVFAVSGAP